VRLPATSRHSGRQRRPRRSSRRVFADGDMVVVLGHHASNVRSMGKIVDNDFVHTFRLAEGKISAFQGCEDSAAVVAAFTAGSN
jgi:ketosteroid isomerase-like protein